MGQIHSYRARLSGPLLDRIDIQLEIPPLDYRELWTKEGEDSETIRKRVTTAREFQYARYGNGITNSQLDPKDTEKYCLVENHERQLLGDAADRLALSARAINRLLKVARTIADLAGERDLSEPHIAEAAGYRCFDVGPAGAR